jgi:hypothetical protein
MKHGIKSYRLVNQHITEFIISFHAADYAYDFAILKGGQIFCLQDCQTIPITATRINNMLCIEKKSRGQSRLILAIETYGGKKGLLISSISQVTKLENHVTIWNNLNNGPYFNNICDDLC